MMTDHAALITEAQRLRNELINIRRLEYVTPRNGEDSRGEMAIKMARKALEPRKDV